jgi:hypothetical protein
MSTDIKYVVLHTHAEGLIMSQQHRDLFFSTGNVLGVIECDLFSLQEEHIARYLLPGTREIILVLWGMSDRYGIVARHPHIVDCFEAKDWNAAYMYCSHKRPEAKSWVDEETGQEHPYTSWAVERGVVVAREQSDIDKEGS